MSKKDQAEHLGKVEEALEREYHAKLEKYARREAQKYEAQAKALEGKKGKTDVHNRELAEKNAAEYRKIESTAAKKTGGASTVRPDDAVAKQPYDPHRVRRQLADDYPEGVDSTTVPAKSKPNVRRRGDRHPRSAVVFDQRGLPIYDDVTVFDTRIPAGDVAVRNRATHMRAATKKLDEAIKSGQVRASQFTPGQLAAIRKHSDIIPGYTWHHHQDRGRMQLVPTFGHDKTGHIGGFRLWYER